MLNEIGIQNSLNHRNLVNKNSNVDESLELNFNPEDFHNLDFIDFAEPFDNMVSKDFIKSFNQKESIYKVNK
jgi:hypothetical protein